MKSFKNFLLEFDPNRGAPGRATPLVPHYPTPDEITAARQNPNPKLRGPLGGKSSKTTRRIRSLSPQGENLLAAFRAGQTGTRWQGTGTETQAEWEAQQRAVEAGKPIYTTHGREFPRWTDLNQSFPSGTPSRSTDPVSLDARLAVQTPGAKLERDIIRQNTKLRGLASMERP
jgi:hypothetical protein